MRTAHLAVPAVLAAAVLGLTGCSAMADALQHQTRGSAASRSAAIAAWSLKSSPPDWIPADATDVRWIGATAGKDAAGTPVAVRVDSPSALPASCRPVQRSSMDPFSEDWSPKGAYPDRVERCGDWVVMPVTGGWYGWTPLAPEEQRE